MSDMGIATRPTKERIVDQTVDSSPSACPSTWGVTSTTVVASRSEVQHAFLGQPCKKPWALTQELQPANWKAPAAGGAARSNQWWYSQHVRMLCPVCRSGVGLSPMRERMLRPVLL